MQITDQKVIKMNLNDIISLSKEYDEAFNKRNERLRTWNNSTFTFVQSTLEKIKDVLIREVDFFKSNLYVNSNTNESLRGVRLFCGNQNVSIDEDVERGFDLLFAPLHNGKILVRVYDHHITGESANFTDIDCIDPELLTEDKIQLLVYQAIETAQKSSLLFLGYNSTN